MLGVDGKVCSYPLKKQILIVVLQNCKKSAVKHTVEKPMWFIFIDLSTVFCPWLTEGKYFYF